jgi:hypothetical protein
VGRALELGDGWIPWEIELDAFRDAAAEMAERRPGFDLIAPILVPAGESSDALGTRLTAWSKAGATAFHLSLEHRSLAHLIERLQALAPLTAG